MTTRAALLAALLFTPPGDPPNDPAVLVRLTWPDHFLEQVIGLFRGSKAPDPATALANWKRATKGKGSLGKAAEAAIAALNPAMIRELATLQGSELFLDFGADGALLWSFAVRDDGTIAAFATAAVLTDGAAEPPLEQMAVDRLGKAGSPLMGREGATVVLAGSREALVLRRTPRDRVGRIHQNLGLGAVELEIDAPRLGRSTRLDARRLSALIRGLGGKVAIAGIDLDRNHQFSMYLRVASEERQPGAKLDPAWIGDLPERASLAFSIALDSRPEAWDRLFGVADRVEKADSSAAKRAPIRARLGLLARVAGIDLERDVWPKLRGITGFLIGPIRDPEGIAIALHVEDDRAALQLRDHVLPRLAKALQLAPAPGPLSGGGARPLADIGGRTLWASTNSRQTVWIGWGEEAIPTRIAFRPARLTESLPAKKRAAIPTLNRVGWFHPGRLGLVPNDSPLGLALAACDPIEWRGSDSIGSGELITWHGLDRGVRRFLELIPQEPAPAPPK